MDAITYTKARKNFTQTMNKVCDDHAPLIITRQNQKPIVMMSLEDYNSIEETLYLLKNSKNASRLSKALDDLKQSNFSDKQLIEE
ncbi:type II toxin-antitoxin system prevent-host-death family antitoxin [Candidatus Bandiella numerosa]|uniref:type II toxin-antitoxin system Phd/YefM family antitoxin n=1 Tax=Candidatus Bandiella numerosa TaxID=2570586 RepID=UPI00249F78FB|nr:type II toxin-antitoxin system prevent-host-death family antitoxin [Candidatus Bandiella numerosa]WHA04317.1 type II toxin-antitoxin system prevent-host-death family antitoxin [Candidatus Bandiella numerosa]